MAKRKSQSKDTARRQGKRGQKKSARVTRGRTAKKRR